MASSHRRWDWHRAQRAESVSSPTSPVRHRVPYAPVDGAIKRVVSPVARCVQLASRLPAAARRVQCVVRASTVAVRAQARVACACLARSRLGVERRRAAAVLPVSTSRRRVAVPAPAALQVSTAVAVRCHALTAASAHLQRLHWPAHVRHVPRDDSLQRRVQPPAQCAQQGSSRLVAPRRVRRAMSATTAAWTARARV